MKINVRWVLLVVMTLSVSMVCPVLAMQATVTGKQVRIRTANNLDSVALDAVPIGSKVEVLEAFDGAKGRWVKVKTNRNVVGYMYSDYLQVNLLTAQGEATPSEPRVVFSLQAPTAEETTNQKPSVSTTSADGSPQKVVEILGKLSVEDKIKGDINKLTESLAASGQDADIRSVIVLYNPKGADAEKAALREEIAQLKKAVDEKSEVVGQMVLTVKMLKDHLREKEKEALKQANWEGEVTALKGELNRKSAASLEESKDTTELKKMISNIQLQMAELVKTRVEEPDKVSPEEIANLRNMVSLLTKMPDFKLISLVESSGENVFLKGVGSVKTVSSGDVSIFRVQKAQTKNAEKLFAHLLKRIIVGDEALYFICNKDLVLGAS